MVASVLVAAVAHADPGDGRAGPASNAPDVTQPVLGCPVDDTAHAESRGSNSAPLLLRGGQRAARATECLLPAKDAVARQRTGHLVLVDVRPASQFERFRIADSLNIPASFVKTKSFLKDQAFALVNEGRDSSSLEERCRELHAAGFKHAAVLRGGINGWRRAGGGVAGDLIAQRDLTRMRSSEYAVERVYPDWLVVSVADVPKKELAPLLPDAVPVSLRKGDRRLPADIQAQLAKRNRKGGDVRVLVVDRDGASYDRLEPVLATRLKQEFYFLEGGLQGYERFWNEQAAVWAAAERPKRPPGCRT